MRLTSAQRREMASQARAQSTADAYTVPAPVGGLNTKDALSAMPETDALIMDNLFPQPTWVEIRGGDTTIATCTGNPETLMPWVGILSSTPELFAGINNAGTRGIFRVDNLGGGAVGAAVVSGLNSTNFDYNQFGTGSGEFLLALTGVDAPLIYDGATWQVVTASSTPFAWTGGPSPLSSLSQVAVYKQRLWLLQGNTMNVYYLPQNVVGGALTLLNMGPNFNLGGFLVAMITISIDNSAGTQDYMAFLSNQGEVVMFQGYDPSSVTTWSLAARFRIGAPVGTGRQCWQKIGMDAAIICQDGLILLSEAMLTDRSQDKLTLSDKVRYGINQNLALYGTNIGWQVLLYPAGNKLLLNVPTNNARTMSFTYVMNTLTGAWCTFGQISSALNAACYENFQNRLYFGAPGVIKQLDNGQLSDDGAPIQWNVKQAFNYMGSATKQKRFTQARPTFQASGGLNIALTLNVDFDTTAPSGSIPVTMGNGAVWNVALWTAPTYWADAQQVVSLWIGTPGEGYCAAPYLQGNTSNISARWMSTLFMFEEGGTFFGK